MIRIMVYGDGPHELGREREYAGDGDLPALPRLVHRLLGEPADVCYVCELFRSVKAPHGKGLTAALKARGAVLRAWQLKCHASVILVDRDRKRTHDVLVPLEAGRDSEATARMVPCAVGHAIETFDAWMLPDGNAIRSAGGDPSCNHPDPEKLAGKENSGKHPKDVTANAFGTRSHLGPEYALVAACIDIDLLRRHCPQGFAPFADEVTQRLTPVVGPN